MEHETGEEHEVPPRQHLGQPLLSAGQATGPRRPRDTPLDDPPAREQHHAVRGRGQLDDLQADDP